MPMLSRKADYALLILSYLHHHPEGGCARGIAEHFSLSRGFLANILKELCQKGFVSSHRGVNGGYVMNRPAESITLAELLEALDDGFRLAECSDHEGHDTCSLTSVCPMKTPIRAVHHRIHEVLRQVTLAELFPNTQSVAELIPLLGMLPDRSDIAESGHRSPCSAHPLESPSSGVTPLAEVLK
ncbi:RrF2 family transcriptional regulator [Tuwongella immobilis]|uniref:Rrf2 family transcriptional regulator n=1 Tax=Tuwongella immobilis TaxID=692036 RepID=A0A6C2YP47_9BACT|nr:Rrf2 family transcriptional regulator [Tuwongella immobilis]VIP02969.1 Putative transcriptional regulator OS=Ignavibacterium album (strain DSM 19864 / JCM 16511 / NBRC 101810 / Mat9-16) GN=IALB_1633 PE=4 SV=1: Rrf2 [Tuwongella immobilis]VTS02995.1 Putative transcriptional regulator OS=Ignavibacterium album (strain DSM 19864 / JCM 16511 / NBRC 101810 / Mat9-16) GN=IALB_1633 PE=4 SV=1: Rrf2 [Tuwongella immobilis]